MSDWHRTEEPAALRAFLLHGRGVENSPDRTRSLAGRVRLGFSRREDSCPAWTKVGVLPGRAAT